MAFWGALAFLLVAVAAGIAFVVVRGIQLYREAKRVGGVLGSEMEKINATTLKIEGHMAKAEAATGRLQDAAGRLAVSRARLQVQLAAVREAQGLVRRVFWFVPGI
jgi:hypothetical protein